MDESEVKDGMAIVMSKRELAAMLAMAGLMASEHFSTPKDFAIRCIRQADALLAALKEETK